MKKILIILGCHPKGGSGVEKVSYEIGKKLSKEFEIDFFFGSNINTYEKEGNLSFLGQKMIKTYLFDAFIFSIYSYFYLKKNKYDLIIDNIGVNLFNNTKTFIIAHGTHINFFKKVKFKKFLDKLKYYLFFGFINGKVVKLGLKKANKVITFGETIKQELVEEYNLPQEKIKIISNGCDSIDFDKNKKNTDFPFKILFISNDHVRKGIDILEEVAQNYINDINIEFNIIGREYRASYNNINYLGKLSREQVYDRMKESNIIFLPSYYEGQPLVVIESMNFGCIPIVSKNCHLDFLRGTDLEKYISDENNSSFYINKINDLISDSKERSKLSLLSLKIGRSLNWDDISNEYLEFIKNEL